MIEITTNFDENSFMNEFEKTAIKEIKDKIIKSPLNQLKCKVHDKYPTITLHGKNLDNLNLNISACCDEFEKEVAEEAPKYIN